MELSRDDFNTLRYDYDHKVRSDYSGRGMYGDTCLAYTGDDLALFVFDLARLLTGESDPEADDLRQQIENLGRGSSDSLGRGSVHYWTSVTVEPDDDDDEDDDDDW